MGHGWGVKSFVNQHKPSAKYLVTAWLAGSGGGRDLLAAKWGRVLAGTSAPGCITASSERADKDQTWRWFSNGLLKRG